MTEPLTASPLLAELRRLLGAQNAVALMPTPMLDKSVGTMSVDPMPAVAIVDIQQDISALIREATDADLVEAYRETNGEPAELDVEALLGEVKTSTYDGSKDRPHYCRRCHEGRRRVRTRPWPGRDRSGPQRARACLEDAR